MKHSGFVIFLSAVLFLYAALNSYIFLRARQALSGFGAVRTTVSAFIILMMLAYPVGRFAERMLHNGWSRFLIVSGSVYLGFMTYAFLLIVLVDLVRLGNHVFHYFPSAFGQPQPTAARITGLAVLCITALTVLLGYLNACHPRVRKLNLEIAKSAKGLAELNIAAVSDLHLGTILGKGYLTKITGLINRMNPDVVLLVGDSFDEDVTDAVEQNLAEVFRGIRSKYGVYAVLGNHEYYGGVEKAASYLRQAGVNVLEDQTVEIADAFVLIGRRDRTAEQMGFGRKAIPELIRNVDQNRPLILLDHQPFHLEFAQKNGIDLQISGHTHHGQLFPFNWITNKVYELSWGYLRKGGTNVIVSCGAGTWGPPVRTGSVPEVLHVQLKFIGNKTG
jgi:predicted MPP superfamily phosphohydrolase